MGRVREEKRRREKIREEKESDEIKMHVHEKVEKSRNTVFFQLIFFCFAGSKSRLAKAGEIKNCTPRWREADLEVKMLKTPRSRTIFGN